MVPVNNVDTNANALSDLIHHLEDTEIGNCTMLPGSAGNLKVTMFRSNNEEAFAVYTVLPLCLFLVACIFLVVPGCHCLLFISSQSESQNKFLQG